MVRYGFDLVKLAKLHHTTIHNIDDIDDEYGVMSNEVSIANGTPRTLCHCQFQLAPCRRPLVSVARNRLISRCHTLARAACKLVLCFIL